MNTIGTRLRCEVCNSQAIVTQPGEGGLSCCGQELVPLDAQAGGAGPAPAGEDAAAG
jgi:hypothetical protein